MVKGLRTAGYYVIFMLVAWIPFLIGLVILKLKGRSSDSMLILYKNKNYMLRCGIFTMVGIIAAIVKNMLLGMTAADNFDIRDYVKANYNGQ